jgi:hypothetical protein
MVDVANEQKTRKNKGFEAVYATGRHLGCDKQYAVHGAASSAYARDRLVDFKLGCKVELIRVHVRNGNKHCLCTNCGRCALRKFDLLAPPLTGSSWDFIGRHEMPDPGTMVHTTYASFIYISSFRTATRCPGRLLTSSQAPKVGRTPSPLSSAEME